MTAGEFAFLALGLLLGGASGAALVEVLRSRPPAQREVRVTVTPASIPTRSSTLALDPFAPGWSGPAEFGPADRRTVGRAPAAGRLTAIPIGPPVGLVAGGGGAVAWPAATPWAARPRVDGTPVRSAGPEAGPHVSAASVGATAAAGPQAAAAAGPQATRSAGPQATARRTLVGVPVQPESDGLYEALRAAERRAALVLGPGAADVEAGRDGRNGHPVEAAPADTAAAATRVAVLTAVADPDGGPTSALRPPAPTEPRACDELRTVAEDRCAVATRARAGANNARDALRLAQRDYDDHVSRATSADSVADPRAVRAAKEAAQLSFRGARDTATSRDELEGAAKAWLAEINRINADSRDAALRAVKDRAAATTLVSSIERLAVEADAARISAETAEEACTVARQAVADCQENLDLHPPVPAVVPRAEPERTYPEERPELLADAPVEKEARIIRLLRGDREALNRTVAELAGDDPEARRRWQLGLTGLVDAVTAQAIEASAVDLPDDDPFWGPFTRVQRRDIVAALASLGYRYDGMSGFADERVPSQRDLSLAVGYAGLDPMRIRRWPAEAEMAGLLAGLTVASDEYLIEAAGGMSLGELVALLGRRADALTDLWNDWGRVRPRLLATD